MIIASDEKNRFAVKRAISNNKDIIKGKKSGLALPTNSFGNEDDILDYNQRVILSEDPKADDLKVITKLEYKELKESGGSDPVGKFLGNLVKPVENLVDDAFEGAADVSDFFSMLPKYLLTFMGIYLVIQLVKK